MIVPVLLCGGAGKRLWPLSRAECPKPFLALAHPHLTLFQQTVLRVHHSEFFHAPLVIGNGLNQNMIRRQLRQIDCVAESVMLEPTSRNTAFAIALAALQVQRQFGAQEHMLILPTDHRIADDEAFLKAAQQASAAAEENQIVVFGITPTHAATEYGYIECNAAAGVVTGFTEKPDEMTAQRYFNFGAHFWNSGMFLCRAEVMLAALEQHAPEVLSVAIETLEAAETEGRSIHLPKQPMLKAPDLSIDYAVMEKAESIAMVPLQAGWCDVGSWQALQPHLEAHYTKTRKPWGYYQRLDERPGSAVKRLILQPGAKLSLQTHRYRAEYWTVISGKARVRIGDSVSLLSAGESVFIPIGEAHRLENTGSEPLEVIEMQAGSYLGEDDIERLDDLYGRASQPSLLTA